MDRREKVNADPYNDHTGNDPDTSKVLEHVKDYTSRCLSGINTKKSKKEGLAEIANPSFLENYEIPGS
jgi:hypothetical protein